MPLPPRDVPETRSLEQNGDSSGPLDAAREAMMTVDPDDTPAQLTRLGLLRGYATSYADTRLGRLASGSGIVEVDTSVTLFRSAASMRAFNTRQSHDFRRFRGHRVAAGVMLVSTSAFRVPRLGDDAEGLHAKFRIGTHPAYATFVDVHDGPLLAEVAIIRADPQRADRRAKKLARALDRRIHRVLAGDVHGRPRPLPKPTPEPSPPQGVPDLSDHVLQARDLPAGSRVRDDAYLPGAATLGSFRRGFELSSGRIGHSRLLSLESGVDVFPSATRALEAQLTIGAAYTASDGPTLLAQLFARDNADAALTNGRITSAGQLAVGDGTFAIQADFDSPLGKLTGVIVVVRVGDAVGTILATGDGGAVDATDLLPLAQTLARRLGPGISE